MMSSRGGGGRFAVGDYVVSKQIGMGSFSTVWHARHRVECTEVAIKEIATARLNSKLKESLKSEIVILKKINHCNIIRLHDMIEEPGKIYIVLEYCRGGDLSMYLQKRHGRIPETTAKHFMQQLASGLQVLRENNLIHRDLKPQNLLLSTNDENSILKIADFGFARSLQPRGLAETLCGSPLYMAPEIMQLQKYDAKADLWSVGAILFQLVTGRTPFTGNNQIQLLQNIMKSTELQFPSDVNDLSADFKDLCRKLLRRNPVERLTFEEFFNHPFLSQRQPGGHSRIRRPQSEIDGSLLSQYNPVTTAEERFVEDLPFTLDDDINAPDSSPYFAGILPERSPYVVSVAAKADRKDSFDTPIASCPEVMDSLESIDKSYVIVPLDLSSTDASKLGNVPLNSSCSQQASGNLNAGSSAPVPNINAATVKIGCAGYMETQMSGPATSQGLMEITDSLEQPSTDCSRRVESLQQCASAITELVNEKVTRPDIANNFQMRVLESAAETAAEAMELARGISASIQSSTEARQPRTLIDHSFDAKNANGWGSVVRPTPSDMSFQGWGDEPPKVRDNEWGNGVDGSNHYGMVSPQRLISSELSCNGWAISGSKPPPADALAKVQCNGWESAAQNPTQDPRGSTSRPTSSDLCSSEWMDNPTKENSKRQDNVHGRSPGKNQLDNGGTQDGIHHTTDFAVPSAPPAPEPVLSERSVHYPTIDLTPVEFSSSPVDEQEGLQKTDKLHNSPLCVICWESPVEAACVPCGHMYGCLSCSNDIKSRKGDCPVCRQMIDQVIKLYAI